MGSYEKYVLINNIKLPIDASFEEAFSVAKGKIRRIGKLRFDRYAFDSFCGKSSTHCMTHKETGKANTYDSRHRKHFGK